jgi:hypothetical protein
MVVPDCRSTSGHQERHHVRRLPQRPLPGQASRVVARGAGIGIRLVVLVRQFLWQLSLEALTIIPSPEPPPRGAPARLPLFRAALRVTQADRMACTDGGMRRWRPMPSLGHTCQHDECTPRLIITPALRRREI